MPPCIPLPTKAFLNVRQGSFGNDRARALRKREFGNAMCVYNFVNVYFLAPRANTVFFGMAVARQEQCTEAT